MNVPRQLQYPRHIPKATGLSRWIRVERLTTTLGAMADGFHPPVEEYLTTIYELAEDGITVIQARLVERLGHSAPSVWEMIKRLTASGHVALHGRTISLTAEGRALAEGVVRKHRLAERLLTDIIGLPWEKAHLEAGRWEHVISDEVEERLRVLLNDPSTCPHGNPIPGSEHLRPGEMAATFPLGNAKPGDHVRLQRVTESVEIDSEAMAYLARYGFITGSPATVDTKAPDGTISVRVGQNTFAIGSALSSNLFVEAATI